MEGLMSVAGVSKTFVSTRALDRVDFDVRAGEVHALIGHNGSGKSTLVKVLAGFHKPDADSGAFKVEGKEIPYGDPEAVHRAGLRLIHQEPGLLDEPTATLPSSEVTKLFELIRRMTARGVGIAYISHRLEEIEEIADRVTVLREGRVVGTGPRAEFDNARLVSLIVGSHAGEAVPATAREAT
ncbi:MAG: ABC transporter ATP-binding protein, partial [Actinobacteria bacterium]|nr:ABC transporter ATP-binding protein [Actinomycetota bacterium]